MKRKPQHKPWYRSRGWWLKQLHNWHWMSAAISLIGMMLFAATGITLNHAATIAASPHVQNLSAKLPAPLLAQLAKPASDNAPLPPAIVAELDTRLELNAGGKPGEWSDDEVYVALPRPGGDAWISIDRASGAVTAEITDRGWISYLNDLHKGRNAGGAWGWFIDVFAGACILFTLTGLFLLYMHSKPRPLTWPLVGLGLVVPMLIVVLFVH
ncbi:PepSY-associated TM helix domain-containing protein [Rhizorhabdus wittichii]|uniref:PepSY-associated TM helix domain-containing protein n=1 Tax=Rhizorhabdus wittichii TaxID=160791 RepID=A0A975D4A4_9SPHN|nr:PepSY-associated TM helix domain-containing protein [Rhizorhabdus wittichii]QTH22747.1 PepSY-associated TM helix domain-containing protein [Rhizorhabdus wittichii]